MRICHSVQSGACTKQPPCARCVWLSARAACARHITPCVRFFKPIPPTPTNTTPHPQKIITTPQIAHQHLAVGPLYSPARGCFVSFRLCGLMRDSSYMLHQ